MKGGKEEKEENRLEREVKKFSKSLCAPCPGAVDRLGFRRVCFIRAISTLELLEGIANEDSKFILRWWSWNFLWSKRKPRLSNVVRIRERKVQHINQLKIMQF